MNQRDLIEYIRSERLHGVSNEQIAAHLSGSGFAPADIEKAFIEFRKNPTVTSAIESRLRKHHPFRLFLAILACFAALLGLLGVLINLGIVSLPIQQISFDIPFSVDTQALAPTILTPALPPANYQAPTLTAGQAANGVLPSSGGVSSDDKVQIIDALLTQDNLLQSRNARFVRNYLRVMAPAADQAKVINMSDSAVLVYAASLIGASGSVGASVLDSPQIVWKRTSNSTVNVIIPVGSGSVIRNSAEIGGVWY
jgi:hypothetical protein